MKLVLAFVATILLATSLPTPTAEARWGSFDIEATRDAIQDVLRDQIAYIEDKIDYLKDKLDQPGLNRWQKRRIRFYIRVAKRNLRFYERLLRQSEGWNKYQVKFYAKVFKVKDPSPA